MIRKNILYVLSSIILCVLLCAFAWSQKRDGTLIKHFKLEWDGEVRTYYLYVPDNLPEKMPAPLVMVLHGGGQTLQEVVRHAPARWMQLADRDKFIVVYPAGKNRHWHDCRDDNHGPDADTDDVGFISALIDELAKVYAVDQQRIYASGESNGGMMCYRLACELSDRIAAIGAVAANNPAIQTECTGPVNPISVLIMNGTADPIMPWDGGCIRNRRGNCWNNKGTVMSTPETVEFWRSFLQADAAPAIDEFPDIDSTDNSTVARELYANGSGGTEVVLYRINNGGHTYPTIQWKTADAGRSLSPLGNQNHDIEGIDQIWEFFKRHTIDR
ncbi:MAG: esterase [Proteobacteria bacterium]|nr:esterase [Pseudomonadota bacterium]